MTPWGSDPPEHLHNSLSFGFFLGLAVRFESEVCLEDCSQESFGKDEASEDYFGHMQATSFARSRSLLSSV
jgi:hypothetical protein